MKKALGSVQNTVLLVVFLIAAILSSFFIFHLQHQEKPLLANNDVTLFNIARNLKNLDLLTANNETFTQKDLRGHWTLLFFGFTHCSDICPTTLDMLARAYTQLKPRYPTLQVVLVSIDPERDLQQNLQTYIKRYHTDFIGTTGPIDALRKLQSQVGVYAVKDVDTTNNYQIQHSSAILLLNQQGQWAGTIRYGLTSSQFVNTVEKSIAALTGTS